MRSPLPLLMCALAQLFGCGEAPAPLMPCGQTRCDARSSYCEIVLSDAPELPSDYTCKPLPASCEAAPSCGCFPERTRCRNFCGSSEQAGVVGLRLTCVGGA